MSKMHKIEVPLRQEESLEDLIKQYLRKSEELDNKEEKVIKQIELMQSAVSSLQPSNQRRFSQLIQEPVHPDVREIEEETQKIKEETLRIQKEVKEKMDENKKLQEEIEKRRAQEANNHSNNLIADSLMKKLDREIESKRAERLEFENRTLPVEKDIFDADDESSNEEVSTVQIFSDKLRKLKKMRKKLKKESEEQSKESRDRMNKLREKVDILEWQSEINRQLLRSLRR